LLGNVELAHDERHQAGFFNEWVPNGKAVSIERFAGLDKSPREFQSQDLANLGAQIRII
jgi:hypothetical protein